MFGRKPQDPTFGQSVMFDNKLLHNYTALCADQCLTNMEVGLTQSDRICLSKCLDRSYEYLQLLQNKTTNATPVSK